MKTSQGDEFIIAASQSERNPINFCPDGLYNTERLGGDHRKSVRQSRPLDSKAAAPTNLALEVMQFEGSIPLPLRKVFFQFFYIGFTLCWFWIVIPADNTGLQQFSIGNEAHAYYGD